jgi:hypothetical protein
MSFLVRGRVKTLKRNWAAPCLCTSTFELRELRALESDAIGPERDLVSSVLAASHDYTLIMKSKLGIELTEGKSGEVLAKINQCCLPRAVVGISFGGMQVYHRGFGRTLVRRRQIRRDACGRLVLNHGCERR